MRLLNGIGLCVDMIKRRNLRTRSIKLLVLDEADKMLNMGELVLSCLCCCFGPIGSHLDLVLASSKLCVLPSNWYSRMSPSSRCASFQMVSIHPSQQVANSDKDKILDALTCLLRKGAISLSHGALDIVDSAVTS